MGLYADPSSPAPLDSASASSVSTIHLQANIAANAHARRRLGPSARISTTFQALPHLRFVGFDESMLHASGTVATLMALSLSYMLPAFASMLAEEKHKGLYQLQRTSGLQRLAFVAGHYG